MTRRRSGALGWFFLGILAGAAICLCISRFTSIAVDDKISLVDLIQLAATFFLALYIPITIESFIDIRRSSRALVIERIREFLEKTSAVNHAITECANSGVTTSLARNQIIFGFKASGMRLGILGPSVTSECGEVCATEINELKECYREFWKSVTSGNIYTSGVVNRSLWQAQEIRFVLLVGAATDLIRAVERS